MRKQALIVIACVMLFAGCAQQGTVKKQAALSDSSAYKEFLRTCEDDMRAAVKIIGEKELVKSLTHFQRMDPGGMRYYPLERGSISETIRSVSKYQYSDCYLINKNGMFVYTMSDNTYFAKRITLYGNTPLSRCFESIFLPSDVLHVEEIIAYPSSEGAALFLSLPIYESGAVAGVFIVRIEISRIKQMLAANR